MRMKRTIFVLVDNNYLHLYLPRRGAPETMERLVATIHEQEVQIHTLQMG